MKKYTNKILMIAIALCVVAMTIAFFVQTNEVRKEIKNEQLIIKQLN